MKGVDTNVLVRYLVADDETQALKAKRYIESTTIYINGMVLCETIWVLESAYGYGKEAIITMLEQLLSTHEIEVEDAGIVQAALHDYRRSKAGFTDCFIGRYNAAHGCEETGSFDRRAKDVAGFVML